MYNLGELLEDFQGKHTNYQIDNFIIKINGKTAYGQYKQALRELNSRFKNLININFEIEELKISIRKKRYEAENSREGIRKIELDRLLINLSFREKDFEEIFREFKIFFAKANVLKEVLGNISDKKDQLEAEFWEQNFIEKIAIDIAYIGTISSSNLETLTSMPTDSKIHIINKISEFKTKTDALKYLSNLEYIDIKYNINDYKFDKEDLMLMIDNKILLGSGKNG